MRKTILTAPCLLLSLLSAVGVCSGKFGTPITDDVSRLSLLKQNIPSDYEIPVDYIPKEVSGMCWVVLNIYPLEQSLRRLANMFGAISPNKDNIIVFITMLKSLRFTFNHEELETAMQVFRCHYRQDNLLSGLYFDYVKELLNTAAQGVEGFPCKPPPCHHSHNTPGGLEDDAHSWSNRSAWFLLVVPVTACVVLILWLVIIRRRRALVFDIESGRATPRDTVPTVSANVTPADCTSVPLHVLSCSSAANALPTGQRGSSATATEHKRIQTHDKRRMKGNSTQEH